MSNFKRNTTDAYYAVIAYITVSVQVAVGKWETLGDVAISSSTGNFASEFAQRCLDTIERKAEGKPASKLDACIDGKTISITSLFACGMEKANQTNDGFFINGQVIKGATVEQQEAFEPGSLGKNRTHGFALALTASTRVLPIGELNVKRGAPRLIELTNLCNAGIIDPKDVNIKFTGIRSSVKEEVPEDYDWNAPKA